MKITEALICLRDDLKEWVTNNLRAVEAAINSKSGVRTRRIVIGTSANGWTASDCDYLCDGTNDAEVINTALAAASPSGTDVVLLEGTYNLNGAAVALGVQRTRLIGKGRGTVLSGGCVELQNSYCELRDLRVTGTNAAGSVGVKMKRSAGVVAGCYINNYDIGLLRGDGASGTYRVVIKDNHFDKCHTCLSLTDPMYDGLIAKNWLNAADYDGGIALDVNGVSCVITGNNMLGDVVISDGELNHVSGNSLMSTTISVAGSNNSITSNNIGCEELVVAGNYCTIDCNHIYTECVISVTGRNNAIGLNSGASLEITGTKNRVAHGTVVTALPTASVELRGQTLLLEGDTNDTLYVCMKVNSKYQWVAK